jgi:hypothetical protein
VAARRREKSSQSGANGDCVEVARKEHAMIAVRDSKDPGGYRLAFTAGQWRTFTAALKARPSRQAR